MQINPFFIKKASEAKLKARAKSRAKQSENDAESEEKKNHERSKVECITTSNRDNSCRSKIRYPHQRQKSLCLCQQVQSPSKNPFFNEQPKGKWRITKLPHPSHRLALQNYSNEEAKLKARRSSITSEAKWTQCWKRGEEESRAKQSGVKKKGPASCVKR